MIPGRNRLIAKRRLDESFITRDSYRVPHVRRYRSGDENSHLLSDLSYPRSYHICLTQLCIDPTERRIAQSTYVTKILCISSHLPIRRQRSTHGLGVKLNSVPSNHHLIKVKLLVALISRGHSLHHHRDSFPGICNALGPY